MFGAIEFYQEAEEGGDQADHRLRGLHGAGFAHEKKAHSQRDAAFHFTLLAEDEQGYRNLVKLVSIAHLDGMYYKPRIDKELLAQHSRGADRAERLPEGRGAIRRSSRTDYAKALELAATYRDILGDGEFLPRDARPRHRGAAQSATRVLPRSAKDLGLGLVAANDVHFLERARPRGARRADLHRHRRERRRRAADALRAGALFQVAGGDARAFRAIIPRRATTRWRSRSGAISRSIRRRRSTRTTRRPTGMTQNEYLREIADDGTAQALRRAARLEDPVIAERVRAELGVLEKQGFVNYFLIVWDFIHWAKEHGIPVGPGRGSAAGSMVAYAMGITDIDPIKFKLLFERFLNPERVSARRISTWTSARTAAAR